MLSKKKAEFGQEFHISKKKITFINNQARRRIRRKDLIMATEQLQRNDDVNQIELINVVVSMVKPAEKTAHAEKYDASFFDMYVPDLYMPVLMLFKPDQSSREDPNALSSSEFVIRIKQSLSKVLVPYYTLAGRSRKTYDLRMRELLCNDEGVPFIEAEIDEDMENVVNIDDFQPLSILSGHKLLGFDPVSFHQDHVDCPLPGIFIQVTKFRCGGISVNCTFLHIVADGKAMFQFLKDWSQMTLDDQISFKPIHDRSLTYPLSMLLNMMAGVSEPSTLTVSENSEDLLHQQKSQIRKNGEEALLTQDRVHDQRDWSNRSAAATCPPTSTTSTTTATSERTADDSENYFKNGIDANAAADSKPVDLAAGLRYSLLSEWTRKTLHVRRECVEKLKEVAKNRNDGFVPTTVDCIHAHLWRGLARIPSSIDGRKSSIFGFPVEGRQRLHEPPLPDSYSGNDYIVIYTQPSSEQQSDDPLVEAAIIHRLLRSVTPQTWLSQFMDAMAIIKSDSRSLTGTSWFRFPLYEADFGFGKPIFATYNTLTSIPPPGSSLIMPPRLVSDFLASVQLCMAPEVLQALLNDSEFRSFFH